jgi:hypothetical protein
MAFKPTQLAAYANTIDQLIGRLEDYRLKQTGCSHCECSCLGCAWCGWT